MLWPFGNLVVIWYIFPRFGILCQEKSGNPALYILWSFGIFDGYIFGNFFPFLYDCTEKNLATLVEMGKFLTESVGPGRFLLSINITLENKKLKYLLFQEFSKLLVLRKST
jgi:hypothetical protein